MKNEKIRNIMATIKPHVPDVCLSILSGWFFTLCFFSWINNYTFMTVPDFTDSISLIGFAGVTVLISALIWCFQRFLWDKFALFALAVSFTVYGISSIASTTGNAHAKAYTALVFIIVSIAIAVIIINYIKNRDIVFKTHDIGTKASFFIVLAAFIAISAYFIVVLSSRTASFCSPCYDMGIFAQMYDNMTETFLPFTTCERGIYLSHFAVHFSPVLYLLLPFCYIFKPTDVLVWAQILVVFSGVFPLWLICRKLKLSNLTSALMSILLLLYPAMGSGAFYDFHENAFLTPLILWTLYFVLSDKWIPTFVFALGVLAVKEDAALYVGFIALYVIFSRKKIVKGLLLFAMTIAYFLFAVWFLMQGSEGIMLGGRYYNIIGYDGGFIDLIRVAFVNPALYAAESFTYEKLLYALNMLVPLAFLPFMTKKLSHWLLIAPLFVINLVTDYQYQYNLTFQYSFGSGALLLYASALNLADMKSLVAADTDRDLSQEDTGKEGKNIFNKFVKVATSTTMALAITASLFLGAARAPGQFFYVHRVIEERETICTVENVLSKIDRSKSVMATSMYLTPLYDVDKLYHSSQTTQPKKSFSSNTTTGYIVTLQTDVVVLDLRPYIADSEDAPMLKRAYLDIGYKVVEEYEDIILVMEKTD